VSCCLPFAPTQFLRYQTPLLWQQSHSPFFLDLAVKQFRKENHSLLAIDFSSNKFLSDAPVPVRLFGQWLFVWSLLAQDISSYFGLLPDFYRRSRGKPEL